MIDYPDKISDNITFEEATRSNKAKHYGIKNEPNEEQLENMIFIAENIFEPVRKNVAKDMPVIVSSFFRHKDLNGKVKGASSTSDHPNGCAMDLQKAKNAKYTNADIFHYIKNHLNFDQLIWEHGDLKEPQWVHVGLRKNGPNRKQIIFNVQ